MAEEKKPKIDLKARLGKTAVGGATPPPPAAGIPVPAPVAAPPTSSAPAASPGLPVPPGIPVGPPPAFKASGPAAALNPSNPLAAAVQPYRAPTPPPPAAPPQPQRIEIDEMAVQEARKGARKQGLIAGLVAAVVVGAVGFIAGGAKETSNSRQRAVTDAKHLAQDVTASREQLKTLAEKIEAGRNALQKEKKFPDTLARELGGINIDFDGNKLAGVRFSGYPQDTTSSLIGYITSVQELNDRKTALASLLARLEKPIKETLASGGKQTISYAVFLGRQDPSRNHFALLAPLQKPIEATNPAAIALPAEFQAVDPTSRANISAPKYTAGALDKAASAIYVLPKSVEAACPSETNGQIAQLVSQLNRVINDVRGEESPPGGDVVVDTKPGMLERAERLSVALNKVQ